MKLNYSSDYSFLLKRLIKMEFFYAVYYGVGICIMSTLMAIVYMTFTSKERHAIGPIDAAGNMIEGMIKFILCDFIATIISIILTYNYFGLYRILSVVIIKIMLWFIIVSNFRG